jgi:hypothetical protein
MPARTSTLPSIRTVRPHSHKAEIRLGRRMAVETTLHKVSSALSDAPCLAFRAFARREKCGVSQTYSVVQEQDRKRSRWPRYEEC